MTIGCDINNDNKHLRLCWWWCVMLVSKIPKALTANNDKQQTNYSRKVTSVKLYIVMYCLKEQRLNRELTIGFS